MREVFVHRYELGQYLIESLKVSLGLKDCKYFGLKLAKSAEEQEDLRQPWLDLSESVCKQIGASSGRQTSASLVGKSNGSARAIDFYLRIKFYPPNLARAQDQFLRHYLWLQLRRDLRLGKLTSSMNNLTLLMACVLQFELGDHQDQLVARIPELNILPNQDLIEGQAIELWRTRLAGTIKHQAQMQFLRAACILETYGRLLSRARPSAPARLPAWLQLCRRQDHPQWAHCAPLPLAQPEQNLLRASHDNLPHLSHRKLQGDYPAQPPIKSSPLSLARSLGALKR